MIVQVEPVKFDGQHWVDVSMDGHTMNRHGPFPDADTAEAMARRLLQFGRALSGGGNRG
jgi:hypothetical protein